MSEKFGMGTHYAGIKDATFEMNFEVTNPEALERFISDITQPMKEPERRLAGYYVPEGSYFPEQLGLPGLVGVKAIHVGFCGLLPDEGMDGLSYWYPSEMVPIAHSHTTEGYICFSHGTYLFSSEGVLDDVFLHEYCHILRGKCEVGPPDWGHDFVWRTLMVRFGLDPVPKCTYVYR